MTDFASPAHVTITIRAQIRAGSGAINTVFRKVTSDPDDTPEDIQKVVTVALRQINDEVKVLIK